MDRNNRSITQRPSRTAGNAPGANTGAGRVGQTANYEFGTELGAGASATRRAQRTGNAQTPAGAGSAANYEFGSDLGGTAGTAGAGGTANPRAQGTGSAKARGAQNRS